MRSEGSRDELQPLPRRAISTDGTRDPKVLQCRLLPEPGRDLLAAWNEH